MMKRMLLVFALSLMIFVLAACGGSESSESSSSEASEPTGATFDVSGYDEFRYDPESITVEAGQEVTINFTNEGVLEHNWLLASSRVAPEEVTEADAMSGGTSGVIAAGENATFTFTAPPAGTYQILCTVPGHAAGGMAGTFTVE